MFASIEWSKYSLEIFKKLNRKFGNADLKALERNSLLKAYEGEQYDLVYSNTVIAIPYGDYISSTNQRTKHIAHVIDS